MTAVRMVTYQFQLRPNRAQHRLLQEMLDACRWVYNETLRTRKDAYEQRGESLSLFDTNKLFVQWRKTRPWLERWYSSAVREAQKRVDLAFKAFFRRIKRGETPGYPRFRGRDRYDSFTYPDGGAVLENGLLKLSKIGAIKVRQHRALVGKVKIVTVRKTPSGGWLVSLVTEQPKPEPLQKTGKAVGIDVGLEKFATFDDGQIIENPRFYRRDEKDLARAQRRLSATKRGSPERVKARLVVAKVHDRIGRRRKDFAHQTSRRIVNAYDLIAVEDLSIARMLKNHCLAKSIADASWGMFATLLAYKAEDAGRTMMAIDPRHTSQLCSACGATVKKTLSERIHRCECGLVLDRDVNAARNILRRVRAALGEIP